MNIRQKSVLILVALVLALMLLFPPFHFKGGFGATRNLGYSFILSPPELTKGRATGGSSALDFALKLKMLRQGSKQKSSGKGFDAPSIVDESIIEKLKSLQKGGKKQSEASVNVSLLLIQYLITVTIGGILYFVFKK
jgi:hypothetical protein